MQPLELAFLSPSASQHSDLVSCSGRKGVHSIDSWQSLSSPYGSYSSACYMHSCRGNTTHSCFPLLASTRSLEAGCGLLLAFSVPSWTLVVCMKRSYCPDGTTVQLHYGSPRLSSLKRALNHHFVVF